MTLPCKERVRTTGHDSDDSICDDDDDDDEDDDEDEDDDGNDDDADDDAAADETASDGDSDGDCSSSTHVAIAVLFVPISTFHTSVRPSFTLRTSVRLDFVFPETDIPASIVLSSSSTS